MYHKSLWNYVSIIIVLNCLVIAGCSQAEPQDKNKEVIQTVLELEFNAPDEEVMRLVNGPSSSVDDGYLEEYYNYIKETYKPYFTDSGYEKFAATGQASLFHFEAFKYDYQINVTKIDVEQNKDVPTNYYFTVFIDYKKIEGDKMKLEIPGIAIFREGKIEKIKYLLDRELWRKMSEGK